MKTASIMKTCGRLPMNTHSCRKLTFEDIKRQLDGVKCIGFDVFDTLLLRPFMRPTDLFRYIEERELSSGFGAARTEAERRARREVRNEIDLDEIYSILDKKYLHLKDIEIETEYDLSIADADTKNLYDKAVELGIDIVVISDMYLSNEYISRMLEKNGYSGYRKLYVSNEHDTNKQSGGLYKVVLNDLGIKADEFLFIGDNPSSDRRVPAGIGIRTVKYVSSKERYAASHKREMGFLRREGSLAGSVIVAVDMLGWLGRSSNNGYWNDIGYRFGGPVASFFTHFMISHISDQVKTIFFIARDGWNLQKVYRILCDEPVDDHYVYASRLFTLLFGEDIADSKDMGAALPGPLSEEVLKKERARYSEYILGKAKKGDVFVVDVTTMKYSSQKLVQQALGKERRVIGCYYNLLAHSDLEYLAYADRCGNLLNWTEVNVPEFFLGSPEGPIIDIDADGGPIFQKDIHEEELFRMSIYDKVTNGETDYAKDLKKIFGRGIPNADSKTIDKWMRVLVRTPSSGEDHISQIRWAPDTMHAKYRSLVFGPEEVPYMLTVRLKDLLCRIKRK